jgi:PAS domain S-box-containing protein
MSSTPTFANATPATRFLWRYALAMLVVVTAPFVLWPSLLTKVGSENYLPHRTCYLNRPALIWTNVISDLTIGLSYIAIAVTLGILVRRARRGIPFFWMFLAFSLFIVACGGTHLMEVLTVWRPYYWLSADIKIVTGIASLATAASLPALVPRIFTLLTATRAAAEQQAQQLRLQSAAMESAANAIVITDRDGVIQWVNPAFEKLTGYSREGALGQKPSLLKSGKHPLEFYQTMWKTIISGEVWRGEIVNRRKDGSDYIESLVITPVRSSEGDISHFVAVKEDITVRKEAERKVLELNQELEDRVRTRTAELEAANHELESFSYSVSHDLRAPLRTLDGFSSALLEDSSHLDENGRHYVERIRAAAQRMRYLIDALLQLSQVTRADVQNKPVDLSQMAEAIIEELHGIDPDRNVEVRIDPGLQTMGDPTLLRAALENLLGNAWKFTAQRSPAKIEFGKRRDAPNGAFYVRDNGAGFDMEDADRLFGPFQRLHSDSEFPGTGVGLATVQRIVRRHHGRIWAEAARNQGATFFFELAA